MASTKRVLTLTNAAGLHARPASLFVQTAARFQASIEVRCGNRTADAKRILQVLQLGATQGATLEAQATGDDAEEAISALEALVENHFGEAE